MWYGRLISSQLLPGLQLLYDYVVWPVYMLPAPTWAITTYILYIRQKPILL